MDYITNTIAVVMRLTIDQYNSLCVTQSDHIKNTLSLCFNNFFMFIISQTEYSRGKILYFFCKLEKIS